MPHLLLQQLIGLAAQTDYSQLQTQDPLVKSIITHRPNATNLLNHILDQSELPAIIKSLGVGLLIRLIRHIGLEDFGPIGSLRSGREDYSENVLEEGALYQVISDYRVISRDDSTWDAIIGLFSHLNETENVALNRLLRRCSMISESCDDDHGNLLKKLSGDEMLEKEMIAFIDTLQKAEVLPPPSQQKLGFDGSDFGDIQCPLISAICVMKELDPDLYAKLNV
jgi:hypothetical protein